MSHSEYKTIELDHGIVIKLYQDTTAENPIREFDGQAHVSVWHRRYDFGNEPKFFEPENFRAFCEEQKEYGNPVYRLPVYLYDHSGLTVNTTGFSCPWDSGQVGWVWATKNEIQTIFGADQEPDPKQVNDYLRGTVKLLDDYLTGNVYGYQIEDREGNELDSCWGFYGDPDENVIPEAKSAAEYYVEEAAKNAAVVESLAARAVERYRAECSRLPAI
jgi:hypothetical protein